MMTSLKHSRRRFLLGGIAAGSYFASHANPANATAKQSAVASAERLRDFLWGAQRKDGRWSSETYAVLGSGQALTPFVLFALLESDPDLRKSTGARRASDWMKTQMRKGILGVADGDVLEYPVFATAFALRCFHRIYRDPTSAPVAWMERHLIRQQFDESDLIGPDHLAYGGWGFGGTHLPGQTGHMDLSHVRWVLSALNESTSVDSSPDKDVRQPFQVRAERFLRLVQKSGDEDRPQPLGDGTFASHPRFDGGFYFSPIVLAANKGRIQRDGDRVYFRSYATATCDGVLSLLDARVPHDDLRVDAAKKWLTRNPDWDYPAGIPKDHPEPWGDAIYFYHQAARAEAYHRLNLAGGWPQLLVSRLARHQQSDGSIFNQRCALMKEDDPILCSALALIAISYAIKSL